ncbi:MAG: hypothetical protein ACTHOI_03275 [Sphingomicrobium sp.]
MVTMVDEIFDRHYQEGRGELNAAIAGGLGRLGHAIRNTFEVLVNIEYQAPWAAKAGKARCN